MCTHTQDLYFFSSFCYLDKSISPFKKIYAIVFACRYSDKRIKGGYEPVPTQDIHFVSFGFKPTWHLVLEYYVGPIAEHNWIGYGLK